MTFTVPSDSKTAGQSGFVGDINAAYGALAVLAGFNVLNSAFAGGADASGSTDSTAAVQAALNAVAANNGGTLYLPAGDYQLQGSVTYSGTGPLRIVGDGPQATRIRLASTSTNIKYLSITQTGSWGDERGLDGTVIVEGLSFHNDHYAGAFSDTNVALYLNGVDFGGVYNCGFYKGTGSQRVNQAIVLNACNQVLVDNCNIFSVVNGIAFTGYCQVCTVRNTSIWQPAGSGVSTAASVLFQGQTLGVQMQDVVFHDGDRAILWTHDGGGNIPHFFIGRNLQANNHAIVGMEFDYGAQVLLEQCVFSGAAVTANVPGLVFGSSFQGSGAVRGCVFNGQPGHSLQIQAGEGFTISDCEFGGGTGYKFASNAYDEINIGAAASNILVSACRFNSTALAGLGTSYTPRSAIYTTAGASKVLVTGSLSPSSGYGTSPVDDNAGAVTLTGCSGL
jgi:hypothetical protein